MVLPDSGQAKQGLIRALRDHRNRLGLSQDAMGIRLGYDRQTVMRMEQGKAGPSEKYMAAWFKAFKDDPDYDAVKRLADEFRAEESSPRSTSSGTALMRLAGNGRQRNGNIATQQDHDASIPPVSDGEVSEAIAEARNLNSAMNAVPLTASTLEDLEQAVQELELAWRDTKTPLPELFRCARRLRNRAATYLISHPTERQRLQLFVLGGKLHAHLAEALLDLGYFTAAWSQTGAGLTLASAAEGSELKVILYSQRSRIHYWQGNYDVAVTEAEAGAASVQPGSLAAVKLFDKLAIAVSRVGDREGARKALHACEAARDAAAASEESYLTPIGEEFCAMGAAASLVILGDLSAAQSRAQHAIDQYNARGSSSVNLTFAQITFAKAQPDPAAAAQLGTQAIEAYLGRSRRSQTIVVTARQLDAMLPDNVPEVEDFRERLHVLESSTRRVIPGV